MNTRYSKKTGCFYPVEIDYGHDLPSDLIDVDQSEYDKVMTRAANQNFEVMADGTVSIYDRPAQPLSEILAQVLTEVRQKRTPIVTTLDGIAGRTSRAGDTVTSRAADEAINALLDITELPELLNATTYEQMQAAVTARYNELSAAAPALVKQALEQYHANT